MGSFALTVQCHKTGVDKPELVDPYTQITNVKVQFRPEKASVQVAGMKKMQTSLVANDITWVELQEKKGTKNAGGTTPSWRMALLLHDLFPAGTIKKECVRYSDRNLKTNILWQQ